MLSIFALVAGLVAHADFDPRDIAFERVFRLDVNDHRSYLIAIDDVPRRESQFELIAARAALGSVCEVLLRGAPETEQRLTAPEDPAALGEKLRPPARRTLRRLGLESLLQKGRRTTTGDAWRAVRERWRRHVDQAAGRYLASLPAPDILELSGETEFDEYLHLAAPQLYKRRHHAFSDLTLMKLALEWHSAVFARSRRSPSIGFEREIVRSAADAGLDVTTLEKFAPPPAPPDLAAVLEHLDSRLAQTDESLYLNFVVADALAQKLAQDYFEMAPATYLDLRDMLAESGVLPDSYFPGEEGLKRFDANVHDHWGGRILSALVDHPTLVSLDARHVLPARKGDRTTSILETLRARGVTVTPITRPREYGVAP